MKVLFLADPSSVHTIKWVNALQEKNIDVYIFGLNEFDDNFYNKKIVSEIFNVPSAIREKKDAAILKIVYLASLNRIRTFIKKVKPDIVHAHYLSSYGLLGSLVNFHPYILSVWGSDIFYVPKKNHVQKKLIEYTLTKADKILSTSNFMARQIKRYTMKEIAITPFGIDVNKFTPNNVRTPFKPGSLILGTTKALEERYGNEYIIRAFRIVKDKLTSLPLKLLLVGNGSHELYLKGLVKELQLEDDAIFTGNVPHDEISKYYNMFDIFLALSTENESFGVSILESLACETPVIVSRVGGFTELIRNEETGLTVESKNIQKTADAIIRLILDKQLRKRLGKNGRQYVIRNYNWDRSVQIMLDIYQQTLSEFNK